MLKQEIFKLSQKTSTWLTIICLIIVNFSVALIGHLMPKHFIARELFIANFATNSIIPLILIAASASIITSEFEYNTIKNLIYEAKSRQAILISKWLTIFLYSLFLYGLMALTTLINKSIFYKGPIRSQYWLEQNSASLLNVWLLLSLVFLIATMIKKSSMAITVGIVGEFALSIIGVLMFNLIKKWEFLKWNPLNFLNLPAQLSQPAFYHPLTRLTDLQLIGGNICYIALFLALGLVLFAQKEV